MQVQVLFSAPLLSVAYGDLPKGRSPFVFLDLVLDLVSLWDAAEQDRPLWNAPARIRFDSVRAKRDDHPAALDLEAQALRHLALSHNLWLLRTLVTLGLPPIIRLTTAFFDVASWNDVVALQHVARFVTANHHGLLFGPPHLLDHIPYRRSSKVVEEKVWVFCFRDRHLPWKSKIFDLVARLIAPPSSTAFQLVNDVAVDGVPEGRD